MADAIRDATVEAVVVEIENTEEGQIGQRWGKLCLEVANLEEPRP